MNTEDLGTLIVDDDYRVAAVHQGFVERVPGFRVVGQAHTAADALESARTLRPDVVLMDVYLPDGDGLQVIRALLDSDAPPIVLVISAASDGDLVRTAMQLGAVHYLVKPFGFAALAERLSAVRATSAQLREWPAEATQADVDRAFESLRSRSAATPRADVMRLAPTLQLVYRAIADRGGTLSATDVAGIVGISRATAQRYLSQLEQSDVVALELRYGSAGRPEHRYSIRRK